VVRKQNYNFLKFLCFHFVERGMLARCKDTIKIMFGDLRM
jgi:hypothetical protein